MNILDYLTKDTEIDKAIAISTIEEILEDAYLTDIEVAIWEKTRDDIVADNGNSKRLMRQARKSLSKATRLRLQYKDSMGKQKDGSGDCVTVSSYCRKSPK